MSCVSNLKVGKKKKVFWLGAQASLRAGGEAFKSVGVKFDLI